MIVTFNNLANDWVIQQNITVANARHNKLDIANGSPIVSLNHNQAGYAINGIIANANNSNAILVLSHGNRNTINGLQPLEFSQKMAAMFGGVGLEHLVNLPIIMISCDSGVGGQNSLAKRVATLLNHPVIAPKGSSIFSMSGVAVIDESHSTEAQNYQDNLVNMYPPVGNQINALNIFILLSQAVVENHWGTYHSWELINNFANDYAAVNFERFNP